MKKFREDIVAQSIKYHSKAKKIAKGTVFKEFIGNKEDYPSNDNLYRS